MKGAWPLSLLNMYSIQLVALQAAASFPHRSPRALSLLEGASTSLQALYMASRGTGWKAEMPRPSQGKTTKAFVCDLECTCTCTVGRRQGGAATVHKGGTGDNPWPSSLHRLGQSPVSHTTGRKPVLPGAHTAQRHPPPRTEEWLRLRMDS